MPYRQEKIANLLKQKAAKFFSDISKKNSLITVTRTEISPDKEYATIFISVFPDEQAARSLAQARGHLRELKIYLKRETALSRIPWLSVEIDKGEKKRQRIDTLSTELNQGQADQ